jgi:hypothetical protein
MAERERERGFVYFGFLFFTFSLLCVRFGHLQLKGLKGKQQYRNINIFAE